MDMTTINQIAGRALTVANISEASVVQPALPLVADNYQHALASSQFAALMNGGANEQASLPIQAATTSADADAGAVRRIGVATEKNSDLLSDTQIPPATMGEGILASMQKLSDEFKQAHQAVSRLLDSSGELKLADMLRLQMNLAQMSFQWDAFSKGVNKSTQTLEQLLKLQ